jgi:hypothetical protein
VHISGQVGEAVVVLLDVLLEHIVGGVHVQGVLLETGKELLGAEVWGKRLVQSLFIC